MNRHAFRLMASQCELASGEFGWGLLPTLGCRGEPSPFALTYLGMQLGLAGRRYYQAWCM